ncbi:uncharacterized protein LOC110692468 isoform X1 [Chenopodium quinoa]|uniref:uncharacterized protein LOC110692468 isoform X1 n=1 Tax=Chenopodium quinoa TaxID=63459 RepID=UPI000B775AE1|nr:uncharacterized protein LOC110692468 isoform X1 [Chenopodium quinoa]XP_021725157.1 uncharacterized protein LOC110692468 isoform X1 [Chenopodium quinoa]XP_021725158.1 uncharacterized protein LOC110692468 isoform X1 [Chenopodium quinoa]XP_021725159.1 uncharacterized protein LOC110692468 isoform X1 [Chenopodium quinoa]XP_021725161.1 uncharacterized protein LOC110692468 isoform X1 [Chenopodium quinoa]XP_021725162.1 uncharacterized protein LOC110692468 isoform X1 [Chenopodium quinoa]XP_02172516
MRGKNEILCPEKTIGSLPGIDVGYQFYSRAEMTADGFHSHWLNGIDYIRQSKGKKRTLILITSLMHHIYSHHVGRLSSSGAIRINPDANMAAGNQIGLGVVLRDDAGCAVAAAVKRLKARWGVEQAEVAAARMGVQMAKQQSSWDMRELCYLKISISDSEFVPLQLVMNKA